MVELALAAAAVGLLGLAVGSFLNVVAYRIPAGGSVIRPPSACPSCAASIRPRDNIPVVSWLLLRGRCRDCGASISARYPLVEAGTALAFVAATFVIGIVWVLPAYLWFTGVTIVLTLTDLDTKRIPNRILYPSTVVAVVLLGLGSILDGDLDAFFRAVGGGASYFGLLLLIAMVAGRGFGAGDVKLAFLLGLFLAHRSWGSLFVGVFLAFLIGGLMSVLLILARRKGRKDFVPFGPSLVAGAWIGIVWGVPIFSWYLG